MSLACIETRDRIRADEGLMCGTRRDIDEVFAVKEDLVNRIPEAERRPDRCEPDDEGLDIHEATSGEFYGNRTLRDFRLGNFVFSVSRETAERYLPKLYQAVSSSR